MLNDIDKKIRKIEERERERERERLLRQTRKRSTHPTSFPSRQRGASYGSVPAHVPPWPHYRPAPGKDPPCPARAAAITLIEKHRT